VIADFLRWIIPERFRPKGYLLHLIRQRTGGCVYAGPFKGMHYAEYSVGSVYLPKLMGIYERELVEVVEKACQAKPTLIIDVGAAEGYYAVGLAMRNPGSQVIAFETEERGRSALKEMAGRNHVGDRLAIHGKCEPPDLEAALAGSSAPFLVCDAEGYETVLLDPAVVPSLRDATILVELHDFLQPGATELLRQRFETTHSVLQIWQEPRTRQDFPWPNLATAILPDSHLDWVLTEGRPVRMSWLWIEPRQGRP